MLFFALVPHPQFFKSSDLLWRLAATEAIFNAGSRASLFFFFLKFGFQEVPLFLNWIEFNSEIDNRPVVVSLRLQKKQTRLRWKTQAAADLDRLFFVLILTLGDHFEPLENFASPSQSPPPPSSACVPYLRQIWNDLFVVDKAAVSSRRFNSRAKSYKYTQLMRGDTECHISFVWIGHTTRGWRWSAYVFWAK